MKKLIGVIGMAGAGKSTFVELSARFFDVTPVYPGKACRKYFGAAKFVKEDNAGAPEFSDSFVLGTLYGAAEQYNNDILMIDGFPRKKEQVPDFKNIADAYDMYPIVTYVTNDDNIIRERVLERDKTEEEKALTEQRLKQDNQYITNVLDECDKHCIQVEEVSNANLTYDEYVEKIIACVSAYIQWGKGDVVF